MENKTQLRNDIFRIREKILDSVKKISHLLKSYNAKKNEVNIGLETNVSGDSVMNIDNVSNNIIIENLMNCSLIYGISSEEEEKLRIFNEDGKYLIVFDPLDGSKNIKCNLSSGSIFGIFQKNTKKEISELTGRDMVYACYSLYSSANIFVESSILDVTKCYLIYNDKLELIDETIHLNKDSDFYYINHSSYDKMSDIDKNLIKDQIKKGRTNRWSGCMVADVHRLLINGGFFAYPTNKTSKNGKLRLLYEAMPMAFIVENSFGYGYINNKWTKKILDEKIGNNIHVKTGVYLYGKL